jgi:hypothetical protein
MPAANTMTPPITTSNVALTEQEILALAISPEEEDARNQRAGLI